MRADTEKHKTALLNTLLPVAQVHVFTDADETKDVFETLSGDWRFGRVTMEVLGTSLDDALAYYANNPSPTVIITQTHDTGPNFQAQLEKLAEYCAEGTSALVIGPTNDVQLYRTLTNLGVSDYLVHPVTLFDMAEAVSRTLLSMMGAAGSRMIAVVGAKGGVGTTTIAHMVATLAANAGTQKTLLMDAAAGRSTLWGTFGQSPTGTLAEASKAALERDHDTLSRIMIAPSEHLSYLSCGSESVLEPAATPKSFENLVERMLGQFPLLVLDLSGAPVAIQAEMIARAQYVLVVTTPTVVALSLTRSLIQDIQSRRGNDVSDIRLIINKAGEAGPYDVPARDITQALGVSITATLPHAPKHLLKAESEATRPLEGPEGQKFAEYLEAATLAMLGSVAHSKSKTAAPATGLLQTLIKKLSS